MNNQEFYADILVKNLEAGETIIRYFEHDLQEASGYRTVPDTYKTEKEINKYANRYGLKIISSTCDKGRGIYVIFEKKA